MFIVILYHISTSAYKMIANMETNNELDKPDAFLETMSRIKDQHRMYEICQTNPNQPPTFITPKQREQPPLDPNRQKQNLLCQLTIRHLIFYLVFIGMMVGMGEGLRIANCSNRYSVGFRYKINQKQCDAFYAIQIYCAVFFSCHILIRFVIYCMEPELGQLPFYRRYCFKERQSNACCQFSLNYLLFFLSEIIELALGPLTIILMLVGFGVFLWRRRRWTSMKVIKEYKELELSRRFCYY